MDFPLATKPDALALTAQAVVRPMTRALGPADALLTDNRRATRAALESPETACRCARVPRRQILRNVPPPAPSSQDIHDAVHHVMQRHHSAKLPSLCRQIGLRQRCPSAAFRRTNSSLISMPNPGPCGIATNPSR